MRLARRGGGHLRGDGECEGKRRRDGAELQRDGEGQGEHRDAKPTRSAQPTRINLQRHPKPGSRFLLEPGELAALVPPELEVPSLTGDWTPRDVHEARLVARRR
jgi:hypothetical protein